ncbi:MAG: DNA primase, partial [Erysipelotrichaceae bacterium]|nr:DNA primase [Erysipelotrichaceae bacterium]
SGIDKDLIEKGGRPLERVIEPDSYEQFRNYQAALAYYKFVMKRRELKSVSSVLYLAKPLLLKDIGDFDSHPFLLNTPAGTYDLRTGDFKDHDPEDYLTKVTSVSPGTEGNEIWQETINSIFCHDQELIDYVQQIVGLAAIGKVFVEALIIAYGDGSNGKSTFWNTIARVLGDYSGVISSDLLTVGCKRNPRPEIAELKGKRLAIAAELAEGTRLNTSIMKQLSSTDEVSAEKKYKDPFKFIPTYSVVLYTNHLPKVGTADSGTWRRLIVIPFNAKLSGNKDIKNYADYLVKHAGGAILSWIIEGASKAIQNNFKFNPPKAVEEALGVYRQSNDWMSSFIEECCEVDRSYIQKSGEFYQEYRAYCMRNGEFIRNKADFYAVVDTLGFRRQRNKKGSFIYGIRLKSDFLEE